MLKNVQVDPAAWWADQLLAFQEISALITASLNLKQTLDTIVQVTTRLIGTQRASIAIREPGTDYLIMNPHMGHVGTSEEFVQTFRLNIHDGVGGHVMRTQKTYVVRDSLQEPLFNYAPARREGVRAWICAPLVSKGESIGLLYALNEYPTDFTDEQVKLATLLANQAAIAIVNARLFEETEQRLRESNALFRVAQALAQNLSLDQLLNLLVEQTVQSVPNVEKAVIHLLDGDTLTPRAYSGTLRDSQPSLAMRSGVGIAGRALKMREAQYVPDTQLDPDFVERDSGFRSMLVSPLIIGETVIGTLSVDSARPRAFTADNRRLLISMAHQAAVAIEKARLFEETLSEKRRIEAIINHMVDGVMMLDQEHRIVSLNPAMALMLGLQESDPAGLSMGSAPYPLDLFAQCGVLESDQAIRSAEIQTGEPLNKVFKVFASPLRDSTEHMLGHVVIAHDVTRERELDQMKSDFLSTVSHELRTPLFSIRGFVKLLLCGKVSDDATRQEFLIIVSQQSELLTNIVNDLLDISRLDSGYALELKHEPIDLRRIVHEAAVRLGALATEKRIRLDVQLPPVLPTVSADARRLDQVLANLIGNAIKFTPEGGRVVVSVLALSGDKPAVQVVVSDTGVGIPADAIPRLFERFYQVDHSATRKAGGTGLGLYITKRIVEGLGGKVGVESAPGRGSRFWFILPVDKRPTG